MELIVKRVHRGTGQRKGLCTMWYANPNNPTAYGVKVGQMCNARSSSSNHCYSKATVKRIFKEWDIVFKEKSEE